MSTRPIVVVLVACACNASPALHATVAACHALAGDLTAPSDFSDAACATHARMRLVGPARTDGTTPVYDDQCVDLAGRGLHAADLFDGMFPVHLSAASSPLALEVSLLPPTTACPDDAPLVALGRSPLLDARLGGAFNVALGVRQVCPRLASLKATPFFLVANTGPTSPIDLTLGEIYPYRALESTGGACATPDRAALRGEWRAFAVQPSTQKDANGNYITTFTGDLAFDQSVSAGCLATRSTATLPDGTATTYSCLDPTQDTKYAGLLEPGLFAAVLAHAPAGVQTGALVIRVTDPQDKPLAAVRVVFQRTREEAVYPADAAWSTLTPSGGTVANIGFAVFYGAPSGRYRAIVPNAADQLFNAGGAADPRSVTTFAVAVFP